MTTIKTISLNLILPVSETNFLIAIFNPTYTGFFSLASIKEPSLILINKPATVTFLTKTRNGMQR
ncbi:MAG: hypothetical protein LBK94_03100 [Prevotellaceae bacterium]|nr:hypothetical protein [Prevotellaceae bacterium]